MGGPARRDVPGARLGDPGPEAVDAYLRRVSAVSHSALAALDAAAVTLDATADHLDTISADGDWRAGRGAVVALLRHAHGLDDSPDAIAARGNALVAEVRAEMEDLDPRWRETVEEGKSDHPSSEALLAAYRAETDRFATLVQDADLAPGAIAPLEIRATPAFLAPTTPYAAYEPPGPFAPDEPGLFLVTVPTGDDTDERLRGHSRPAIALTAAHEAYPGHHLQLDCANRAGITRAVVGSALTIEGWAFYCEHLMGEVDAYGTSVTARLFLLKDQLWRAVRVVVDMAMHAGDMTEREAVDMLVEVAGLEPANAMDEVRRYTSTPTYQIAYAIGKDRILRLQEAVRARDGAAFSLGGFHRELLGYGSIPVPLAAVAMLGSSTAGRDART